MYYACVCTRALCCTLLASSLDGFRVIPRSLSARAHIPSTDFRIIIETLNGAVVTENLFPRQGPHAFESLELN